MNLEASETPPEMIRVTIDMPVDMHARLQLRARLSGAGSVTEYLRRGEAAYSLLVEKALDSGVLVPDTVAEITLRTSLERVELPPILPFAGS